ncbi:MAG TPA: prepilin-type N-terminal cleavage/methylation domain-containing protein [Steroidobacteraceae bacterium]|nr:prepilin-type N-terminal cleavage/methylation domain-containing protein [Steroidobacteraceae bacterium]
MRRQQQGFTLIELLVAVLIGLFLLGGLLTIVQDNRRTFGNQSQLSQLQDNERLALTIIGDIVQESGYFPDPTIHLASDDLPAAAPFAAGQSIYGTTAAGGDTLYARFVTAPGDGIINCSGGSNPSTSGANSSYTNVFSVSGGQLLCSMNGTSYTLVGSPSALGNLLDIKSLNVMYGVKTNAAASGNNVDDYLTATQVTAGNYWGNVISVRVTLSFSNPLYVAGQGQPQTLSVQRLIAVMNQTGIRQ